MASRPPVRLFYVVQFTRLNWSLVVVCLILAFSGAAFGQFTITEINPDRSTLDPTDADGASGGRVNGLGGLRNGQTFYAASEWGGLYRSTNGGRVWARLNGHPPTVTWDVEVDPSNANRVFATSFYDGRVNTLAGISVSNDGGNTWTRPATTTPPAGFCFVDAPLVNRRVEPSAFGISIDPANPRNVFVGTNCGLAISNDSGATWRYVDPTPADGADDIWDVVAHGGIIDLCGDDGHRRSTNGGVSWTTATGVALPSGRCSLAVSPDESYVLFAVAGLTIFESDDGGNNWATQFVNPSPQGRIPFVATNQRTGAAFNLWFGDIRLHRANCTTPTPRAMGGAARCSASNTWAGPFTRGAGAHDDAGDIIFGPPGTLPPPAECLSECEADRESCIDSVGEPGQPTAAQCNQAASACRTRCRSRDNDPCPVLFSSDGGVYFNTRSVSPDCQSPRWEQPNVTPHALWLFAMSGADRAGFAEEDLYFGNQDNGTFATTNAGANPPTWTNRDCCDSFDFAANSARVLHTVCCFNMGRFNRLFLRGPGLTGGAEINTYPPGNLAGFLPIDMIDRFGPDDFIVLTTAGLFITNNITANPIVWTQLGAATSPVGACGVRAVGATANPTFYVQAGSCLGSQMDRLFRFNGTAPNGNWQRVNPPGLVGGFGIFAADPNNANRLFASQLTPAGPRMILSNNGGANWVNNVALDNLMTGGGAFQYQNRRGPTNTALPTGPTFAGYAQPTLVAIHPLDRNTLLAGGSDSGVFLSLNGGVNWQVVTNNAGTAANPHIPRPQFAYFDQEGSTVNIYIGTQGRGVWRVGYRAPTCNERCNNGREACLAGVGQPGNPTAAQCAQQFTACQNVCSPPPPTCFEECATERDECFRTSGEPGGLSRAQCLQLFRRCRALCP
ncbi:MAG: hypothetical protein ACRD9R_06170 [Pyrinomonadaceae bacterium]